MRGSRREDRWRDLIHKGVSALEYRFTHDPSETETQNMKRLIRLIFDWRTTLEPEVAAGIFVMILAIRTPIVLEPTEETLDAHARWFEEGLVEALSKRVEEDLGEPDPDPLREATKIRALVKVAVGGPPGASVGLLLIAKRCPAWDLQVSNPREAIDFIARFKQILHPLGGFGDRVEEEILVQLLAAGEDNQSNGENQE